MFALLDVEQLVAVTFFLAREFHEGLFHAVFLCLLRHAGVKVRGLLFLADGIIENFVDGVHEYYPR